MISSKKVESINNQNLDFKNDNSTCCSCIHHNSQSKKLEFKIILMIILTFIFFLAELITGYITKSLSLQSDSFHMLSDVTGLLIGYFATIFSSKTSSHTPFGYKRSETIGGLSNSIFLILICFHIFSEAITRIIYPEIIEKESLFILVGFLGFIVNLIGILVFHSHQTNDNVKGIYLHVIGDLLGSIGVLISAFFIKYTNFSWKYYIDSFISLIIIMFLFYNGIELFLKTSKILINSTPNYINLNQIKNLILENSEILSISKFYIWEISNNNLISIIHCEINNLNNFLIIQKKIKKILKNFNIKDINIHINLKKN